MSASSISIVEGHTSAFCRDEPFCRGAAQAPTLEEVVVTAQKRVQSLQDVPIAITALGAGDLERLNSATLTDIQYSTPNLTVSPNAAQTVWVYAVYRTLRNPGYDNRVSVYVDGIFVGAPQHRTRPLWIWSALKYCAALRGRCSAKHRRWCNQSDQQKPMENFEDSSRQVWELWLYLDNRHA